MSEKDKYHIWVEAYICSFHRENPAIEFAGCACCSALGMYPKDIQSFIKENKRDIVLDDLISE